MGKTIDLVCFDWGGVILRHCRSWAEGCAAAGLPLRAGVEDPALVAKRREMTQLYQVGKIGCEEFYRGLVRATGDLYTIEELHRLHDAWLLDEYAGVARIIRLLTEQGVQTALLSNTNHRHWVRHLPKPDGRPPDYPTAGLLTHRHASHLLGHAKPGSDIYRAFEEKVGVRGDRILFFDDMPENITAAESLGWRSERIDHTGDTARQIERVLRENRFL